MSAWKKLGSRLILEHPRLHVFEDIVRLPDGSKTDYIHFGDACDSVTTIVIDKSGKLLVQKEYNYPSNEWLYQFPGGNLEIGETPEKGGARELAEEARLQGDLAKIGQYLTNNRRSNQIQHVFIVKNLKPSLGKRDPEESFEEYWLSEEEIESLIHTGKMYISSALSAWAIYKSS